MAKNKKHFCFFDLKRQNRNFILFTHQIFIDCTICTRRKIDIENLIILINSKNP